MKIDKETLVKNHFWILLGIYAPMVLVALMLVWFGVSDTVGKEASELKKTKDELNTKAKGALKNSAWVEVLKGKEETLGGKRDEMWKTIWDGQAAIMTWPPLLEQRFPMLKSAYFLDKLPTDLRDAYIHDNNMYYSQLKTEGTGIVWIVRPVGSSGEGTVQFKNGWENVLTYVPDGRWPKTGVPDSDDCWLAQEDIWVQRELLLCVKTANEYSAAFKKMANPPKKAKGEIDHQIFTNARWKLELILSDNLLRWQLTNLTGRRQPLGMFFNVKRLKANIPDQVWVDGEPLAPNESSKWGPQPFNTLGSTGLDSVEEVFDWRTATVKRIDRIDLYHHSHRTNSKGFTQPVVEADPNAPPDPAAAAAAANPAGAMAGGPMGMGMRDRDDMGPGAMGPFGGMAQMQNMVVNKFRYLDWNKQVRRMAVGIVLIVDQPRIQDVLTALANSRLRLQITQVHWQHYTGSIKPIVDERNKNTLVWGANALPMPGRSRMFNMGRDDYDAPSGGFPMGASVPTAPGATTDQFGRPIVEESANVVELAVYGVCSLYQKFPPKTDAPAGTDPAAAAAGGAPGAPGTTQPAKP